MRARKPEVEGPRSRVRRTFAAVLLSLMTIALVGPAQAGATVGAAVQLEVLSNRADLISGGDALVEVRVPAGAPVEGFRVEVDGRDPAGRSPHERAAGSLACSRVWSWATTS